MAVHRRGRSAVRLHRPERLGVIGGSYGGYMTSWIVGHTNRFKAAVLGAGREQRGTRCKGSSDIGWVFKARDSGRPPGRTRGVARDVADHLRDRNMTTPLLILHSENDLRCPIEQARAAVHDPAQLLKRDVEFVRFPAESPRACRGPGSPCHRVQRFEIILDWFDRKL